MHYDSDAHSWIVHRQQIMWVRICLRLISPFAIGWYLLTGRELSIYVGNITFMIQARDRSKHSGLILGHRRKEGDKPGTFLRPKVYSEKDAFALSSGKMFTVKTLTIEVEKALFIAS